MRAIAKDFTGYGLYKIGVQSEEMKRQSRVLPSPLFRYSGDTKKSGVVDGVVLLLRRFILQKLSFLVVLLISSSLWGQPVPTAEALSVTRHERMLGLAKSFTISNIDGQQQPKLRETPIFSWTNPEVKSIGGELYLWTVDGRPLATIGIWTYDDVKDSYELQSLTLHSFEANSARGVQWKPRVAGLAFQKLEGAPAPDSLAVRRQFQMRNIIRERFSGEVTKRDNKQIERLRFLPQPVYRYDPLPSGLIEGAMFTLAFGTDPEIFVLIEVRKTGEAQDWYYAFAPSTSRQARGFLDGRQSWDNSDQSSNGTFVFIGN